MFDLTNLDRGKQRRKPKRNPASTGTRKGNRGTEKQKRKLVPIRLEEEARNGGNQEEPH